MKIKDPNQIKTARDARHYARRNDWDLTEGGSHTKCKKNGRMVVIPRHSGDLATGTRNAIIKIFLLACLVIGAYVGLT